MVLCKYSTISIRKRSPLQIQPRLSTLNSMPNKAMYSHNSARRNYRINETRDIKMLIIYHRLSFKPPIIAESLYIQSSSIGRMSLNKASQQYAQEDAKLRDISAFIHSTRCNWRKQWYWCSYRYSSHYHDVLIEKDASSIYECVIFTGVLEPCCATASFPWQLWSSEGTRKDAVWWWDELVSNSYSMQLTRQLKVPMLLRRLVSSTYW